MDFQIMNQFNWLDQPRFGFQPLINLSSQDVDRRCQERVLMGKDTAEEKAPVFFDAGSNENMH